MKFIRETYQNGQLVHTQEVEDGINPADSLASIRFDREVSGVIYLGHRIQTDRETRANWIGILIQAQSNPSYTVTWKTMDGFVTYNAQEAIGAALTTSNHVQKCFKAESSIDPDNYNTVASLRLAFDEAYDGA